MFESTLSFFGHTLRRFLAARGYALSRIEGGGPETLESYLLSLSRRCIKIERVYIFDANPEPLRVFVNGYAIEKIVFCAGPELNKISPPVLETECFLIEIDAAALEAVPSLPLGAYLKRASIVVVRAKLIHYWSGEGDVLTTTAWMASAGFRLHDVIQRPDTTTIRAHMEDVFLIYEREDISADAGSRAAVEGRLYRISEASNHLSTPIAGKTELSRLTGRGSYGCPVGLYNPGAVECSLGTVLLARGERTPWAVQKRSAATFAASCQPMLLTLEPSLQIAQAIEVRISRAGESDLSRLEDFRLFSHAGRIYSNHSILHPELDQDPGKPIRPERLRIAVGISLMEVEKSLLTLLGSPVLDRPVALVEKNWAMFSVGECVHLIYSFNPYRLFSAPAFPSLDFKSVIEQQLNLPIPRDPLPLRNSINPISYDSDHLLHIVHKVYPGKHYVFWAVLIDKRTLTPSKITTRPLLRAGPSGDASIIYACSALNRDEDVVVFGGIDDSSIGAWRIKKTDLDRHWVSLA